MTEKSSFASAFRNTFSKGSSSKLGPTAASIDQGSVSQRYDPWDTQHEAKAAARRRNDEILSTLVGLDFIDSRKSKPGVQGNPPRPKISEYDFGPSAAASSGSSLQTGKRSKLERMMGPEVPLPPAPPSSAGHRQVSSPTVSGSSSSRDLQRRGSIGAMSDASSSHSRGTRNLHSNRHDVGMVARPLASSNFSEIDEVDCPVCLEPLSYRLAGEKPHVVPNCGHALHNACFTAVYGPPEQVYAQQTGDLPGHARMKSSGSSRARQHVGPPGMCGVCRRPIALGGDDTGSKAQKVAGLMGPGSERRYADSNGRPSSSQGSIRSVHEDDAIDNLVVARLRSTSGSGHLTSPSGVVNPIVKARPEHNTIYRKGTNASGKQNVVCVLSIEVPSRRPSEFRDHRLSTIQDYDTSQGDLDELEEEEDDSLSHHTAEGSFNDERLDEKLNGWNGPSGVGQSPPPRGLEDADRGDGSVRSHSPALSAGFSYGATPAAGPEMDSNRAVIEDLRQRISDWKGHSIEHFGNLILHDNLSVRQDTVVRDFNVYLFEEALLCVTEEKKKGLSRFILPSAAGNSAIAEATNGINAGGGGSKPPLKLKGRIYLRHIRRVLDSSTAGEMSISIKMDDDSLDHFVLCFEDRSTLEMWKSKLTEEVSLRKPGGATPEKNGRLAVPAPKDSSPDPTSTKHSPSEDDNVHLTAAQVENGSRRKSGAESIMSGKSGSTHNGFSPTGSNVRSPARRLSSAASAPASKRLSTASKALGASIDPRLPPPPMLPHAPIDLVIMISVPAVLPDQVTGAINSSAALKLRLVRSTLEFIVSNLGTRDRVALVAYTIGVEGEVRRTALLNTGRDQSKRALDAFLEGVGKPSRNSGDPFVEDVHRLGGSSERIDTITAVNVGLDIVLQRKAKNPVTGMILVNDTADGPRRGQMDLVMARAEAANVPIHCFGYGKSHDPSSLWLISNHTKGSYTFVKEWYQLRECLSGCVGSLMSVALTDVKVHIGVPLDNRFRVRKVAGPTGAVVSSTGKDVDIEIGDLRFGDLREILIEMEVDLESTLTESRSSGSVSSRKMPGPPIEQGSATDDFMQRLGIQSLSLAESDGYETMIGSQQQPQQNVMESPIEEVAVFQVDVGFKDPAAGLTVTRMSNPSILTVEIDSYSADPMSQEGSPGKAAAMADPVVTRRRLEILVSDMITRSLLLVSRKNHAQALKILTETKRIIETVVSAILPSSSSSSSRLGGGGRRSRQRNLLNSQTIHSLNAILDDLEVLTEGLETSSSFERDGRNFGAQQAMVLRDQKAWTSRTDTEFLRFRDDNSAALAALGATFTPRS
ncbi:hypothetical protein IE53DRAFT_75830 [Violaceomyces palustris]|uniref:Uncharacterized protein n=1 Tax=Violaceomyces palustris TaxID=1673888 RepID=A0ACD0NYG5_9BASI|nr:hypothetical protein IE53DRAFT_75830 [Violaceomyces palustris]